MSMITILNWRNTSVIASLIPLSETKLKSIIRDNNVRHANVNGNMVVDSVAMDSAVSNFLDTTVDKQRILGMESKKRLAKLGHINKRLISLALENIDDYESPFDNLVVTEPESKAILEAMKKSHESLRKSLKKKTP